MPDGPNGSKDEQSRQNESGNAEAPAGSVAHDSEHGDPTEHQNRAQHYIAITLQRVWRKMLANSAFWTAAATVAIAVATVIYTHYAKKQWDAMNSTLSEIQKQTPQIEKQANLAQQQLTAQQDAFRVTQRAWVVVAGTGVKYIRDEKGIPRALGAFSLVNTGPSPAFRVHLSYCFQVRSTEPHVTASVPSRQGCRSVANQLMGTNVEVTYSGVDPTVTVQPNSLPPSYFGPGKRLYAWGWLTYSTFAKDGEHFTSFCLAGNSEQMGPCQHGNDGD